MKKRILSILLCFCIVMSLIPTTVWAADDPSISIGGVVVDNNDWYAITDTIGTVTTQGAISINSNIHVVLGEVDGTPTATVTLKNATIENSENRHAINVEGYDLNIVLEGTSNQIGVNATNEYGNAIYSSTGNNVTITGEGDLTLKGSYGINVNGLGAVNINTTGNLNIASVWQMVRTSGDLTASAKSIEATGYYFYGYAVSLTATDGDIHATGSGQYGIQASGDVTVAAPNGAISVKGTEYAIKATDYSVNVSAKNDVTLTGTVQGKEISITSETGNLTINGYFQAIESAQTSVTLSAPSGDIFLNASRDSIISGINNFTLAITAAGKLEAKGPYGIESYGIATIKADKVSVENTSDGYGFNGGALAITSPSGGNCSEVYISGGKGNRDAINAYRDVSIKADKVVIKAAFNAEHAINASSIMGGVTVTIGDTGLIVGSINIIGTNAISTGMLHAEKNGNNASYGLNLNKNTPSQSTYYKAGDGYVIFVPVAGDAPATLLLNNATIQNQTTLTDNTIGMENEGIALPTGNIIIKVEGTNSITSSYGDGIGYLGSHVTLAGSGVLNVYGTAGDIMLDDGSFSFADGADVTLNAVVSVTNDNIPQNTNTVYGNMTINTYFRSLYRDAIIANGATVTIPEGQMLWMDETDSITINGQIVNNGTIVLPYNYTIEQIQALNLTGNIWLCDSVEDKYRIYVDGSIYAYGGKVDYNFSINSAPTEVTYYETINGYFIFTPATDDTQAKLTLHNVDLFGDFTLPNIPLTFDLQGVNTIESIDAYASIIIEGNGKLDVYDFKNSKAEATLTVNNGATLNAKYNTTEDGIRTNTIYGNYTLSEDSRFYVASSQNLVLSSGAVFTLRENGNLEFHSGTTLDDMTIGAGASIVNNTHITLPQGTTPAQIAALPLSGSGVVRVTTAYDNHGYPETWDTYTNEGLPITVVDGDDLTLTDTEVLESDNKGYTWSKTGEGNDEVWTLTLKNLCIDGSLYLPNKTIVINSTADSIINGNIGTDSGYALDITFTGTAPLTISGWISGGIDGDILTVENGANVTVDGSIFLGSSGGANGTLNVTGAGTTLNAYSSMGYAVMCDSVNVQNGATMNVKAQGEDSIGVEALTGVSITGGSTLTAGCDYGVYITDGKLTVDDNSKLITNAAVAPFCILDTTSAKSQSDVLYLSGKPEGTEIDYVKGTTDFSGSGKYSTYWSLVKTVGSLKVSDENNEPVTLTGAVQGEKLEFKIPTYTVIVQNDGNGTASANLTTASQGTEITLTATPNSNYKFKEWQVISGGATIIGNKFTMPNGNVTVRAMFEPIANNNGGNPSGNNTPYNTKPANKDTSNLVKDGILTYHITEIMAKDVIKAAQDFAKKSGKSANGIVVEFTADNATNYHSLVINIDSEAVDQFKKDGVKFVKIGSSIFAITLDTQTIAEIDKQSIGMVTISAMKQNKLSDEAKKLIGNRPVFDITVTYQKNNKTEYMNSFGKGMVTLGICYKAADNEKADDLFGFYVDKNGKPHLLSNSIYANGKMIIGTNSLSTYGVGHTTSAPVFTDTAKHWAKDNIDFIASRDLISGTSTTTFTPNTAITRATFLMALGKLSSADVSSYKTSSFTDVKNTDPAMPYIEWAVKNKIVNGIGNGKFGTNQQISRQDMAVMMLNYTKATGYELPVSVAAVEFFDNAKISAYAKNAVAAIQQAGIMAGKGNSSFDPKGKATRAEASTILRHFVELIIDEEIS